MLFLSLILACTFLSNSQAQNMQALLQTVVPPPAKPVNREATKTPAVPVQADEQLSTQGLQSSKNGQKVMFSAVLTDGGEPIARGLVWRFFKDSLREGDALKPLLLSREGVADVMLDPGGYILHVAYGHASLTHRFEVEKDKTIEEKLVLDAGALKLSGALMGDVALPMNKLKFDIYAASDVDTPLLKELPADTLIRLNAGVYQVVSRYGAINAVVKTDVQVEAGKLTEAKIFHKAAKVHFKLVSEVGGEAIAGTAWTVENMKGDVLFTEVGAFPSTILEAGEYVVLVKSGEKAFSRRVMVQPQLSQNIEILAQY